MDRTQAIVILLHESDPFPKVKSHLIWSIARAWRKMGIRMVVRKGISRPPPAASLVVPHIDLTATPPQYREYISKCSGVLNRDVMDISKRVISRNLLSHGDPYGGLVIVKTDRNSGGRPEQLLEVSADPGIPAHGSGANAGHLDPFRYMVFEHLSKVPAAVWSNPGLVVERFIPEREGQFYCIRICVFLGDAVLTQRVYSRSRIVKGNTIVHTEAVDPHEDLATIRRELGFDYGKFDYVVHEGRAHLLDANRTPGGLQDGKLNLVIGEKLARGVEGYLGRGQPRFRRH